jgi:hypothetical protein
MHSLSRVLSVCSQIRALFFFLNTRKRQVEINGIPKILTTGIVFIIGYLVLEKTVPYYKTYKCKLGRELLLAQIITFRALL